MKKIQHTLPIDQHPVPDLPPECQAPPTREVSVLTGFAQSSGSLSVGLENLPLGGQTTVAGTISFLRRTDSGELMHIVEFSSDLGVWAAGGTLIRSEAVSSGIVRETWQSPESIAARSRCFGRVRIP